MRQDPPDDWREREAVTDDKLLPEEKELLLNFPNTEDFGYLYSDIPTFIKWVQSIGESKCEWVRINDNGEIVGISAIIPKGMIKLQSKNRKSQNHSSMVSYGNEE